MIKQLIIKISQISFINLIICATDLSLELEYQFVDTSNAFGSEIDVIMNSLIQTNVYLGSQFDKCPIMVNILTSASSLITDMMPSVDPPSPSFNINMNEKNKLKDFTNCYDQSKSTTQNDKSSSMTPYNTNLFYEYIYNQFNKNSYTQLSDSISLDSKIVFGKVNFFLLDSKTTATQKLGPTSNYIGVFNMFNYGNQAQIKSRSQSNNQGDQIVDLFISDQASRITKTNYILFHYQIDDSLERYLKLDMFALDSTIQLNHSLKITDLKLKLSMTSNFILLSKEKAKIFFDLVKEYLRKTSQTFNCYISLYELGRQVMFCKDQTQLDLLLNLRTESFLYSINFWDMRSDVNDLGYQMILVSSHDSVDNLVILGFKYWNYDAYFDNLTDTMGFSTQQFSDTSNNGIKMFLLEIIIFIIVFLQTTQICFKQFFSKNKKSEIKIHKINMNIRKTESTVDTFLKTFNSNNSNNSFKTALLSQNMNIENININLSHNNSNV